VPHFGDRVRYSFPWADSDGIASVCMQAPSDGFIVASAYLPNQFDVDRPVSISIWGAAREGDCPPGDVNHLDYDVIEHAEAGTMHLYTFLSITMPVRKDEWWRVSAQEFLSNKNERPDIIGQIMWIPLTA
jgi:hypothetical protein